MSWRKRMLKESIRMASLHSSVAYVCILTAWDTVHKVKGNYNCAFVKFYIVGGGGGWRVLTHVADTGAKKRLCDKALVYIRVATVLNDGWSAEGRLNKNLLFFANLLEDCWNNRVALVNVTANFSPFHHNQIRTVISRSLTSQSIQQQLIVWSRVLLVAGLIKQFFVFCKVEISLHCSHLPEISNLGQTISTQVLRVGWFKTK
jgi:hypothetical protein